MSNIIYALIGALLGLFLGWIITWAVLATPFKQGWECGAGATGATGGCVLVAGGQYPTQDSCNLICSNEANRANLLAKYKLLTEAEQKKALQTAQTNIFNQISEFWKRFNTPPDPTTSP